MNISLLMAISKVEHVYLYAFNLGNLLELFLS